VGCPLSTHLSGRPNSTLFTVVLSPPAVTMFDSKILCDVFDRFSALKAVTKILLINQFVLPASQNWTVQGSHDEERGILSSWTARYVMIMLGCVVEVSGPYVGLSRFPGSPGQSLNLSYLQTCSSFVSRLSSSRHSLKELQEQPAFARLSHFTSCT